MANGHGGNFIPLLTIWYSDGASRSIFPSPTPCQALLTGLAAMTPQDPWGFVCEKLRYLIEEHPSDLHWWVDQLHALATHCAA